MKDGFQFLKNKAARKWVILAPKRAKRPDDRVANPPCPFCEGNEDLTPKEVYRLGEGEQNKPGWKVRVVPNKYPFTPIHEIIIHSPDHEADFFTYQADQLVKIFNVYRQRYNHWQEAGNVLIFYNKGKEAGESRLHNHTQLTVVPKEVEMEEYATGDPENIAHRSSHFSVFIPQTSQWPYEVWFLPEKRRQKFGQTSDEEIDDLAKVFQKTLRKLKEVLEKDFPFNFYIYHGSDWYLRVIPRLKIPAGFELASGIFVNTVDPALAARKLSWNR